MKKSLLPSALILLLAVTGLAQELRVNGSLNQANVPIGKTVQFELTGTPGQPHLWFFDLDPGPTMIAGVAVPIGFSPALIDIGMGTPLPASGEINLPVGVDNDPSLVGVTVHSVAGVLDAGAPLGWALTNGISFTFVGNAADAGPDGAALVGQGVTLDGSGNLGPSGQVPMGTSLQWVVIGAPSGASPQLQNAQGAFPVLVADLPGTYSLELQVTDGSGLSADHVRVDAFDVAFSSPGDGTFTIAGSVNASGTVLGPVAGLEVNGQAVTVQAGGAFDAGSIALSGTMNPITARVVAPSGATVDHTVTVINGVGLPVGTLGAPGSALRIGGASLDLLETPVELVLGLIPLNEIITAIPPVQIINTPIFTSTIAFTSAGYDPNSVDFDLFPSNGHIGLSVTFNQLVISADLSGSLLFGTYSETASITATSVVVSGELVIGSNAQGGIEVTMQNTSATANGFNFSVTGVLNGIAQLGALQSGIQGLIETSFAGILDLVPTLLNPALGNLVLSADLSGVGIPMQVDFPLNSVVYDMDGLTVANDFAATALTVGAETPSLTESLSSVGAVPAFGTTTPVNMAVFDLALATNDELYNQSLTALTQAGVLNQDLTGSVGQGTGAVVLTAGALATLMPGAGFEAFDPSLPVSLAVRHTTAPAVTFSPTGMDQAALHIGNMHLDFAVEVAVGVNVPVLSAGVSATAGLTITVDPMTNALSITPGTATVTPTVRGHLAGAAPANALAGIQTVVQQIIPLITGPLSQVPLPGALFGNPLLVEVSVSQQNPDTLTTYFDIP